METLSGPKLTETDKALAEKQLTKIIQNKPQTSLLMVILFVKI